MGAVSRRGVLRLRPESELFDVEQFRTLRRRTAVVRDVTAPTLVLGSTQADGIVARDAEGAGASAVVRRRSGGGAVHLAPGAQLWVDVWVPRDDPLWADDVSAAAEWVGAWWVAALRSDGLDGLSVHRGRADPGPLGGLVCFAGRGPGEVFHEGRKVVGLSQWRAREGALFSACAYVRWDPAPLVALLHAPVGDHEALVRRLTRVAVGLAELEPAGDALGLRDRLLDSLPSFAASRGAAKDTPGGARGGAPGGTADPA